MNDMTNTQQRTITIAPKNRRGGPATLDGAPVWTTDDDTKVDLQPAADGLSCVVVSRGPVTDVGNDVTVSVDGDADLGAGVTPIHGSWDFTITAGQATELQGTVSDAIEQPSSST